MKKRMFFLWCLMALVFAAKALTWDEVISSGEYYYGIGVGADETEADAAALSDMSSQIATHVSGDFMQIDETINRKGNIEHKSNVLNCIRTYSQATITNSQKWDPGQWDKGKNPKVTIRRYMKKSELARIFDNRIEKARGMIEIANECLDNNKIDMALQYYYWAYSLVRSVQFPNEVKDGQGRILVDLIPMRINEILSDIDIKFSGRDGDYADFDFTYKGLPVSSLEYTYSDGRTDCIGLARDGKGMIEMLPGYNADVYHLNVEYEFKNQARGDVEMESVLAIITPKSFPKSAHQVKSISRHSAPMLQADRNPAPLSNNTPSEDSSDFKSLGSMESLSGEEDIIVSKDILKERKKILDNVLKAISSRNYSDAAKFFTVEGLQMFNRLISYGKARILNDTNLKFYPGLKGRTVARGVQMSFSFTGRNKKTFVEDVSFTFDQNNKIENVAFGMGRMMEESILENKVASWSPEVREIIISFMENYKTAYSLERYDYIKGVFDDDATIIVGTVIKKNPYASKNGDIKTISLEGQELIKYSKYTKNEYLEHLKRVFNNNEFINLKFSNHEVQWLEKFESETLFAINICQQYTSSTYSDVGYLFLLVDMTNVDEPLIRIRTWQPNVVSIDKLYNAGDFFDD